MYSLTMYIKKTLKKDPKTGKPYKSYHLVESVRTSKGPRQRTLLYMGCQIEEVPEQEHKILADRIADIIAGQACLLPCSETIEKLAQMYASQLIHRLSEEQPSKEQSSEPDYLTVDVNSIEQSEPRSVGAEHLLLRMADQLELSKTLRKLGFSESDSSVAMGSIIARAVNPDSERSTYSWLCNRSGLGELLDFDFKKSSLDKLYQISDKLLTHKTTLEEHLETVEQGVHGFQSRIVLYDLTNTYMEGQARSNPKARHGVSKEKRADCPLVTLGLVINEHGFLHRSSFLPGNASEPKSLQTMIESLDSHDSLLKPIIILDAGISSVENLQWLREHGYKYIVSARQEAPSTELEGKPVPVGDLSNSVKAALIKSDSADEKWLYCESEAKAAVAKQMKLSFRTRFEEELEKLSEGLTKPKARKKYPKVLERLGRLKEKHKRISGCYEIDVSISEDGKTATKVEWRVVEEKMSEKLTGKYFLRTNLLDEGPKELWQIYNTLRGVEDAFRFMKSSLGLRPVYHQKEHRVDGHLWITILAYHLIQNCLYQLRQQGITYEWKTILKILQGRIRVSTQAKTESGKTLHHRSSTKAEGEQLKLYRALGLSPQILRAKKIVA